jgi:hypothetical protein
MLLPHFILSSVNFTKLCGVSRVLGKICQNVSNVEYYKGQIRFSVRFEIGSIFYINNKQRSR